ncbi:unnamed protein product [Cylicostephanus goldi]|uniref:Uncharacterized protein n=1 Tax=Cylicostephanus goldi TaxID=71465 RepID=A0A3P6T0W4_CYLGO|nr:unnamed protein product [Cylicostephanus goldi]
MIYDPTCNNLGIRCLSAQDANAMVQQVDMECRATVFCLFTVEHYYTVPGQMGPRFNDAYAVCRGNMRWTLINGTPIIGIGCQFQ